MPRRYAPRWPRCGEADTAAARQAADLAYFHVLIHSTRNRALGLLYRWVEHAFGGREHELTGAYDDAEAVVADLRAITDAVLAHDAAAAAAGGRGVFARQRAAHGRGLPRRPGARTSRVYWPPESRDARR